MHSILQGNVSEDHFVSVSLQHQFPCGVVGRFFWGDTCRLHLPDDWHNDFCGFFICVITNAYIPRIKIFIKQEDPLFNFPQESNEAMEPICDGHVTCVGYVSFSSLRHTTMLTSSYNVISVTIEDHDLSEVDGFYGGVELLLRKSESDEVHTTNCSNFWDRKQDVGLYTFTIQQCDSERSIDISWKPFSSLW